MEAKVSFEEDVDDGWLSHEMWTDFWRFRIDHDWSLSDDEMRRIADRMVAAGNAEIANIVDEANQEEQSK